MTHLEVENLVSDYLDGVLGGAQEAELLEHLRGCDSCRELVTDVRRVMQLCRAAEELEPAPWLTRNILLATVGEPKPSLRERMAAYLRPVLQPRFAYGLAMAVFSFSIIVNAAGINLRRLSVQDLNPRTWVYQASRNGHLLYARAEKFYYDLRVVYEIESRLKQLRQQPGEGGGEQKQEAPKQRNPGDGSSEGRSISTPQLASVLSFLGATPWLVGSGSASSARSIRR
jgi:hypothetical protein